MSGLEAYDHCDPRILRALGLVVVVFSELESTLAHGVAALIAGARGDDGGWYAARKMSFSALVELFGGLYRYRFPEDGVERTSEMCKTLASLAQRRNEVMHAWWQDGDTDGTMKQLVTRTTRRGPSMATSDVSELDLLRLASDIDDAYWDLNMIVLNDIYNRVTAAIDDKARVERER